MPPGILQRSCQGRAVTFAVSEATRRQQREAHRQAQHRQAAVEWCKGKTSIGKGTKIPMAQFVKDLDTL
jgi:hypothetical protein